MSDFAGLVDDFCATEWSFHPIDASFAGSTAYDAELPPADATSISREIEALSELRDRASVTPVPDDAGSRLDAQLLRAQIAYRLKALQERPQQYNPAYYTGEVAFGIISLLLPAAVGREATHLAARLRSIPEFLSGAAALLDGRPVPSDWINRANTEIAATSRLLQGGMRRHSIGSAIPVSDIEAAVKALHRFGGAINDAPEVSPAAGSDYLAFIMRDVHGLGATPESLEREAEAAFERVNAELEEAAARLDPRRSWREQFADLTKIGPSFGEIMPSYAMWHHQAMRDASELLTPASDYGLEFRSLPPWALDVVDDLYFLPYRSPAPLAAGNGSTYWIAPTEGGDNNDAKTHNTAAVKLIHAVHHGSIGHHTQNARARGAASRLARIAGTDCASALAYPAAGTMVEGWACYAEDLLAEVPGFYTPSEKLQLIYFELRNIASTLVDIRLHTGVWNLAETRRFYREEVAFSPARILAETTRNSIYPGTRLMYWSGIRQIRDLRRASALSPKAFHDRLLSYGAAPVAWIGQEMSR